MFALPLPLLLSLVLLLGFGQPASATKRVALVIGNSAYQHTAVLANPKNDASDIAATLKTLGFVVLVGHDLDKAAMDQKIREFALALSEADVAVLFYAGHGLQVGGQNYLVPVDAQLTTGAALDFEMVRLDLIQRTMERETSTNVIFLDACRDNPLARNLARAMGTRSTEIGRGLSAVEAGVGTLISFSTQPGNVALDGVGRNSPFAAALAQRLSSSADDLSAILIGVRNDVIRATKRKQVPWEHSALTGRLFFRQSVDQPAAHSTSKAIAAPTGTADLLAREAAQYWVKVERSDRQDDLEAFIRRYGDTFHGELAKNRLASLQRAESERKYATRPQQKAGLEPLPVPPRPRSANEACAMRQTAAGQDTYCVSSVLGGQEGNTYRAVNLFDGATETAWVEGHSGSGVGEWVVVAFNAERIVSAIRIANGYDKYTGRSNLFRKNNRVRQFRVTFSSGREEKVALRDTGEAQLFSFSPPERADWVQLTIDGVYRGTDYDDTAVSELEVVSRATR